METEKEIVIKYSSYTEAQKKATKKYRENNKDKVNNQRKAYYQKRKEKDPQFLNYKRLKAKEYYQRNKAVKKNLETIPELSDPSNIIDNMKETEFMNHKQTKAKEYYQRKKDINKKLIDKMEELRLKSKDGEEIKKILDEIVEETKLGKVIEEVKEIEYPILEEKIKRIRRNKKV
jgi:hypothetical protein